MTSDIIVHLQWEDLETGESKEYSGGLPITFGRLSTNTLVLNSSVVSRSHARLEATGPGVTIVDLGSSNGITVDGEKVKSAVLSQGTIFQIGPYAFTFGLHAVPAAEVPQAHPSPDALAGMQTQVLRRPSSDAQATMVAPRPLVAQPPAEMGTEPPPASPAPSDQPEEKGASDSAATGLLSAEEVKALVAKPSTAEPSPGATVRLSKQDLESSLHAASAAPAQSSVQQAPAAGQMVLSPADVPHEEVAFPPDFFQSKYVRMQDIHDSGVPVDEVKYLALGGGMGSFIWADHLRVYGVGAQDIAAIGFDPKPYGRFRRLCLNSQIPEHERLRSDSSGTPDNIWGWPGYALREIFWDLGRGHFGHAIKLLWTIFGEPVLANTYTPIAGRVFASLDREAARIGWHHIWRYGRVRALRMTDDGRYVVAYSQTTEGSAHIHKFMVASYVQVALGYPGIRLLPDLMEYRKRTGDFKSVVNAYEDHEQVYQTLIKDGGTVMLRGRGIVASRILQRLYEARKRNPNIQVIHLNRTPVTQGHKFEHTRRKVANHWEIQPLNFPKAVFGGRLRAMLEEADPQTRNGYINDWGGTTTADRADWQRMVQEGISQGWMKLVFGAVQRVDQRDGKVLTTLQKSGDQPAAEIETDFVIDATGLNASLDSNPVLKDLLGTYHLERNIKDRVNVTGFFEMDDMRNQEGVVMVAGAMALGGPFAAVDSFAGMQFCARRSLELLHQLGAPGVRKLGTGRSIGQFLKWARGVQP